MIGKKILLGFLIVVFYLLYLWLKAPGIYTYKFDEELVEKYKRSQDITYGVENRIHISDNDIYISAGYLYFKGEDPTQYNFQHPPFVKYLYGLSAVYLSNPYWVQIVFGILTILLTYILGLKIFKNMFISALASILLIFDPVFFEASSNAFLDLGQSFFALLYLILFLYYPYKYMLQGLVLGLFFASKFWTGSLIFILILPIYKLIKKEKMDVKRILFSYAFASVVFISFYFKTYLERGRHFDIFFFEAKTIKFMLSHNSSENIFGSLILFITGYFNSWWNQEIIKSSVWSVLWPLGFLISVIKIIKEKISVVHLISIIPVIYLLSLVNQFPFTRYFVLFLPYLYLTISKFIYDLFFGIPIGLILYK